MTLPKVHQYCGRSFRPDEIAWIRAQRPHNRAQLSRQVCEQLNWRTPDGRLKEMSCRVALLRMLRDGLISLPAPTNGNGNGNGKRYRRRSSRADPGLVVSTPACELTDLALDLVRSTSDSHLWNEYIDRYHYLGYQPLPGAQLRYFARGQGTIVGLLGFGAAAWTTAARDRFIGWTRTQRKARLHLVVNNARFLIPPWVTSRHLASRLLGMVARRLPDDWAARYGYRPLLLETFVERERFKGTCYKAANWRCLGETTGRGKLGDHAAKGAIKTVWVYPLAPDFRERLTA